MRLLLAAILVVLAAIPARAQAEPFPGTTWLLPRDGDARVASELLDFTVYLDQYEELPGAVTIAVASAPDTDAEGLLADPAVIARYEALPLARAPYVFLARTPPSAQWRATPGTYYWQATYEKYEGEEGEEDIYASAVHSVRLVPAPPPDPPQARTFPAPVVATAAPVAAPPWLRPSTARIIVRRAILVATHRSYRGLTYRCLTAPGGATCRPSWRDARYRYRGTLRIGAGAAGITASFSGTRAARSCTHRCARANAWTTQV